MQLTVNEIFYSIQGESTYAGRPCTFIRLTGCNLRCSYCDTQYAYDEGEQLGLEEIMNRVFAYQCPLVEITGGGEEDSATLSFRQECDGGSGPEPIEVKSVNVGYEGGTWTYSDKTLPVGTYDVIASADMADEADERTTQEISDDVTDGANTALDDIIFIEP